MMIIVLVNGAGCGDDTTFQLETMQTYPDKFVGVSDVRESVSATGLREPDRRGVNARCRPWPG